MSYTMRMFDWNDGERHSNPNPHTMRGFLRITMAEWDDLSQRCTAASRLLTEYESIYLLGYVSEFDGKDADGRDHYTRRAVSVAEVNEARLNALLALNHARQRCYEMIVHWKAQPPQTEGRAASRYAPTEVSVLTKWYRRVVPGGQWLGQEVGITGGFLKVSSECVSSAGLGLSVLKEPNALGLWAEPFRDENNERWYW